MKSFIKRFAIILIVLTVVNGIFSRLYPKLPLLKTMQYSRAVFDEQQHLLRLTLSEDAKYRLWTPLAAISPHMIAATLLQEDQYFRWHIGVNPVSLVKAIAQTYLFGSRRLGASTITMQVARLRFGIHSKTWSGKLVQIMRALQLEYFYSKDEILQAYFNLAPYGNNIEGIGAASLIYFGKMAKDLTLHQALALAVVPQNPSKRIVNYHLLKQARHRLFKRWLKKHPEDHHETPLINLPLQMRSIHQLPFFAPHFVNSVLANALFQDDHIVTTLNLSWQRIIERTTKRYLARHEIVDIHNAAILVVDSRDMRVKAMLGSANFFSEKIGGQINGTDISRSPGSTLKPFIYALALDQGLIHPDTMLKDVPRSFGSYNPENFDNDFIGPIKAKEALTLSRNIPAVYLADQLKRPTLYEFLQQVNIRGLKSESYYGLSLVLGGAELTMQELVMLYATLANEGKYYSLRMVKDQPQSLGKQLLSPEASFLVLDMLSATQKPGGHFGIEREGKDIAWKTGTSSGYRDAWTMGVWGPYVVGVWLGNFNNQSNHALIGKTLAAPLFFEIIVALTSQHNAHVFLQKHPEHLNLTKTAVCKTSGMLPTRNCLETEKVWFIPGKSPIQADRIHREVAIDSKTGLRVCHFNQDTQFKIYEFWPSDLLKIFKQAGIQRRTPPPYDPTCNMGSKANNGFAPQITSPQSNMHYVVRLTAKENIIPFTAIAEADVKHLYWFLNEVCLGKTERDQAFLWLALPGRFVVRVVDDFGRSHGQDIKVELSD